MTTNDVIILSVDIK